MLPDNSLSSGTILFGFDYPVKSTAPEDRFQDWELAGVDLNDSTDGLLVKVWHGTLEIDLDTSIGSVYVEADGVAKTLLFSDVNITEVALAFDQNMNPFVAYTQAGAGKFYWYDSTLAAMTHTSLPAGCRDLQCCLDEKRPFNIANSDIILAYVRDDILCVRYQRDRYLLEYELLGDVSENLIHVGMSLGLRVQFGLGNKE